MSRTMVFLLSGIAALGLFQPAGAEVSSQQAEGRTVFRGEIRMELRDGGTSQSWRYRYDETRMRIDRTDRPVPAPPVNLLDFESGTLRLLHPYNGTWQQGSLKEGNEKRTPKGMPALPDISAPPPQASPAMSEMPQLPAGLPAGIGPGAGKASSPGMGPGGMPMMPEMPMMPPMGGASTPMELVAQNQTNTLFGFSCRLYTVELDREGTVSAWLCSDPALPPFYLLRGELASRHDRPEWRQQLAQLFRQKKMFPLRLELKGEDGGQAMVEWNVSSIKTDLKENEQAGIFEVPEGMHRMPEMSW